MQRREAYEDVVGLYVGMQDVAFAQEGKAEEHLVGVCTDGFETDADVADAGFLEDFPEVETAND